MILIFIIAVSLSMDAFSLSIAYGTTLLSKKEMNILSLIVGLYHFFMPIIGMMFGKFINSIIHIKGDIIVLIIFSLIGLNMIIESFKTNEKVHRMRTSEMILFGFAVSIDSFSIGIGINNISNNYFLCSSIFFVVSLLFTRIGLLLGNKLNKLVGKISTIIGGIALMAIGMVYIIN